MHSNTPICSKIPSDAFDFDAETGIFSQEISMLQHAKHNPLRRVWSDSCDEGFVLVSTKTGKEVVYSGIEFRRHEDITHWVLTPYTVDPVIAGTKVIIWNT